MLKPLKVVFGVVLVVLLVGPVFAQTIDTAWVRRYNGPGNLSDQAWDLAVDDSGNVYVTGNSYGGGATMDDYATIKYLPNGDTAWVRRFAGPEDQMDIALALAIDGSGNVYVTGESQKGVSPDYDYDYLTVKYLPSGDTAWIRGYDGSVNDDDMAHDVTVDGSGNVYVTGSSMECWGDRDIATIKYFLDGSTIWVQRYSGLGNGLDDGLAIAMDGSGDVYVTGYSIGLGTNYDYVTMKYCSEGGNWRTYDGPANSSDLGRALAIDGSGNVYVTGYSIGSGTNYDYATIKYLPSGDTVWVRRYNGPGKRQRSGWCHSGR